MIVAETAGSIGRDRIEPMLGLTARTRPKRPDGLAQRPLGRSKLTARLMRRVQRTRAAPATPTLDAGGSAHGGSSRPLRRSIAGRGGAPGDGGSTHGDGSPETEHGGALAPRADSTELVEGYPTGAANPFLTGGAGLFDHSERDAVSPATGSGWASTALALAVVLGGVLVVLQPRVRERQGGWHAPIRWARRPPRPLGRRVAPGSPEDEGQHLIAAKPCVGCHIIPGVPGATGTVGPNLTGVASRAKIAGGAVDNKGVDDLKAWILNPAAKKPGTLMPNVGLSDDEATKIAAYLETLK